MVPPHSSERLRVLVRNVRLTSLSDTLCASSGEDIVLLHGETLNIRIQIGYDSPRYIVEHVLLHQHFGAHAGVDPRRRAVLVAVAVNMARTETKRRQT